MPSSLSSGSPAAGLNEVLENTGGSSTGTCRTTAASRPVGAAQRARAHTAAVRGPVGLPDAADRSPMPLPPLLL
ncbi:hypothetical protein ANANG_G00265000 [Anguilla anguilla]|uniref:Uncharacterized protein n=1 Tax=Anguilla anguilla TaxID=7936 RepID=A0A9D3RP70_ANGAN|nr:hypothetical protein ANANG_G00265000 [Anguilla anguilla]